MVKSHETDAPSRAPAAQTVAPRTGTAPPGGPKLLDRSDVKTTMIYTHVLNRGPSGVQSPVDGLCKGASYADPHNMPQ